MEDKSLYKKALEVVLDKKKASATLIQRELQIGYNRAAIIIDTMEKGGVISAANEVGKRTVLLNSDNVRQIIDTMIKKEENRVEQEKEKKPDLPGLGHNSETDTSKDVGGVAGQRLRNFIERVERLEAEKAALMEDSKEVYAEAKGVGFDVKIMRKIVSLRKMDTEKRREEKELLDLYLSAIGMY